MIPRAAVLLLVLASAGVCFLGEHAWADSQLRYYRSNGAAMLLEEISIEEREQHKYYLTQARPKSELELRTLYREGDPILTRRLSYRDGAVQWEEDLDGEVVLSRREFSDGRRLQAEERFEEGELALRLEYSYREHRIERISAFDREGALLYCDHYSYRSDGRLRRIVRSCPPRDSGSDESGGRASGGNDSGEEAPGFYAEFRFVEGMLRSEWHEYEGHTAAVSYDRVGRLAQLETWLGDSYKRVQDYQYQTAEPGSTIEFERIRVPQQEWEELRRFDDEGMLSGRVVQHEGQIVERGEYEYAEGLLIEERRYRQDKVQTVRYDYDEDGSLREEAWVRNGEPERLRQYHADRRVIELRYRDGRPVLRIEYRDDERLREEVIRDGEVVRVREYGTE